MKYKSVRLAAVNTILFLLIFFLSPGVLKQAKAISPQNDISLDAKGALLIDMQSGNVLYKKNGDDRLYPASTTKILTSLLAIENGNLDDTIIVGEEVHMIPWDSSKALLQTGEQIKLRDLLMGLMLPSGNDAAMTVAVYVGRKVSNDTPLDETKAIEKFVQLMNERAKKLGTKDSYFVNPHGYDNKNHYTTPHDLALISREAMKNEFFREVVATSKYNVEDGYALNSGPALENIGHTWRNTNQLINKSSGNYYEYATGIKTGFTTPAGQCIVSSASKDGLDLIAVVLNSTIQAKWEDPKKLLSFGFDNYICYQETLRNQVITTLEVNNPSLGSPLNLIVVSDEDFTGTISKNDVPRIQKSIVWNKNLISPLEGQDDKIMLLSSIRTNQVIGKIVFTLDGNVLDEINLRAAKGVKKWDIAAKRTVAVKAEGTGNAEISITIVILGIIFGAAGILMLLRRALLRKNKSTCSGNKETVSK